LQQTASVQLFVARAKAVRHDFSLTPSNAAAVAAICVRLDGIPLAIELAVLTQGHRDRLPRQQTLRAAIGWSYHLLTPKQQRLFMRLALFAGGCPLSAVASVCNAGGDLGDDRLEEVEILLDHSLLHQTERAGELWLTWLETLREYALEQLAATGEEEHLRLHHLRYYRTLVEAGAKAVEGAEQPRWLERFAADYENIQVALAWSLAADGMAEEGLRLAGASWWTWWALGLGNEGRHWLERLLVLSPAQNLYRANALYALGTLTFFAGDLMAANEQLRRALTLYQQLGNHTSEAHTRIVLAGVMTIMGDPMAGEAMIVESIRLFRREGERWGLGLALVNRRLLTILRGEYEVARAQAEEALSLFRTLGQPYGIGLALNALADITRVEGNPVAAVELYSAALSQMQRSGVKSELPSLLHNLAYALLAAGEIKRAESLFCQALSLQQQVESRSGMAECFTGLAGVAVLFGDATRAAYLFGVADSLYGHRDGPGWPPERIEYERYLAATRAQLDAESFATAWQQGHSLSLEAVIEGFLQPTAPAPDH
jgi:tetratricopeptide (TPR) repeat protein